MRETHLKQTKYRLMKWFLGLLLGAGIVIIAQASLQTTTYLPLILNEDMTATLTPTPSQTPTSTGTITITATKTATPTVTGTPPTATPTRTPTPTPTLVPGVFIVDIEYAPLTHPLDEYVTIRNQFSEFIPLDGWTLRDDKQNVFTFPRYTLVDLASVKIWTKGGVIDPENLYWGRSDPVWNDYGDCAYLRDEEGKLIDSFCYGSQSLSQLFP